MRIDKLTAVHELNSIFNKKEFSFITKCKTKCSEILNVRYWWILIYFKTYSPTKSRKPPLLKLSEWASGPNGRF